MKMVMMTVAVTMIVLTMTIMIVGYCDRDEFEGCENDECYDDNCGW